jgi:hypothetical protein
MSVMNVHRLNASGSGASIIKLDSGVGLVARSDQMKMCTLGCRSKMNVEFVIVVACLVIGTQAAPLLSTHSAQLVQVHAGMLKKNATNGAANLECGVTSQVGANTDKYESCPTSCPYFAQNREDPLHCTFLCVPAEKCGRWNPNKPIADTIKQSRTCRGPMVPFCSDPQLDGTDTCKNCQSGFALNQEDGQCYFSHWTAIIVGTLFVVAILTVVIVWFVDLCCRETVNDDEVTKALHFRSRAKILQPKNLDGHRHPWPLNTNLCKTDIAGLGMLLHFNFQAFCIVWPLVIAIMWTVLACFHSELWILGTRKFGTPRHNCILVAWGYETQQRLMWTKVLFLAMVYVFSFVSFLLFSVRQYRIYQEMDATEKTMKKFALELKGLPELAGSPTVEMDLKKAVETATGQNVVGVSVAWNYGDDEDVFVKAVQNDQNERAREVGSPRASQEDDVDPTANMGPLRKKMYNIEKMLLGPDDEECPDDKELEGMLGQIVSSDTAFVVFKTSEAADNALDKTESGGGVAFQSHTLTLSRVAVEPGTVNWQNFGDASPGAMTWRFWKAFFTIYVPSLAVWFFLFYVPYALSLYNFNYDNGAELPGYYSIIFTIVVVGGNATMYVVCDLCAEQIGFKYKDTKQCVYMLMYLFACMFNVLLDMAVTYYTALKIMVGLDFRTYDGTRLADIDAFTDQFETYAMQRSLGGNTYAYAFPSTFLVPFLIEPIVTVLVPYQLGKLIIRTHREVQGNCAETYIAAFDFDLGRYADILLNVFLGILIFFFPGGYTWTLFYGMFISHIVIYLFDHWRVIDVIPNIKITSYEVDWWAQAMLAACCALILSSLVFKANCESYAGYCIKDMELISATSLAGAGHFVVHMLLLIYLVPKLGKDVKDENEGMTYEAIARDEAYTWFSVNPVHCLRSKLVHKHKPYCRFVSPGKEHLVEVNEAIGCYFSDVAADVQDFSAPTMGGALAAMRKSLSAKVSD